MAHVAEAKVKLGTQVPWLCDGMDNAVKVALGNAPNSAYIFDAEGRLLVAQAWCDAESLRTSLAERHGAVEPVTSVADLDLPASLDNRTPGGTIVPRVELDERLMPLVTEPGKGDRPFYVKLRAEATQGVMRSGEGRLYLGFHVDPIHDVHWNNLVDPVAFTLSLPEGVAITPGSGTGPKVTAPTDVEPREFLLDVSSWPADAVIEVTVRYFACSDTEGWCKPVAQHYVISNRPDRQGGAARIDPGGAGVTGKAGGRCPIPCASIATGMAPSLARRPRNDCANASTSSTPTATMCSTARRSRRCANACASGCGMVEGRVEVVAAAAVAEHVRRLRASRAFPSGCPSRRVAVPRPAPSLGWRRDSPGWDGGSARSGLPFPPEPPSLASGETPRRR